MVGTFGNLAQKVWQKYSQAVDWLLHHFIPAVPPDLADLFWLLALLIKTALAIAVASSVGLVVWQVLQRVHGYLRWTLLGATLILAVLLLVYTLIPWLLLPGYL